MHSSPHTWHGVNRKKNVIGNFHYLESFHPLHTQIHMVFLQTNPFAFRLRLADILVRPMQRLTKYNLLLSAIRKHITEESEAEIMDLMVSLKNQFLFFLFPPQNACRSNFSS